jgi:hypothetical protein
MGKALTLTTSEATITWPFKDVMGLASCVVWMYDAPEVGLLSGTVVSIWPGNRWFGSPVKHANGSY